MTGSRRNGWTLAVVSVALFMVVLDNLVVSVALPTIHRDLGASIQSLEWTVNAYVLAYAVLLLTGAALGDRFGRKRMFVIGMSLFTLASALAALAPSTAWLVAARAAQGAGAAAVTPLTLTLLAEAFPAEKRGIAIGVWSGISGIAVAVGPLVGGAVVEGISWHWIFWINVPIGLCLIPLAARVLAESHGPYGSLDIPGLVLGSSGLFGIVFGLVRAQSIGWGSPEVLTSLIAGSLLLAAFVAVELRTREPMLPMGFFAKRSFAVTNVASLSMYFGMFGSIFFLSQYMQNVLHNTPLQAGLKLLVWTGATMVVAPLAGVFSERIGSRPFMVAGLALQAAALAWLATLLSTSETYSQMLVPFVMAGAGMALVFAPSANAVLASVTAAQAGQASGANNAIREVGGVLGVAVLASVFTGAGGYGSAPAFIAGLRPAMWVAVAVLAAGSLVVLAFPFAAGSQARADGSREDARRGVSRAPPARRRVPAAERREELISAAVHEFAHGGLHGTPVQRIAARVGVAQPYVFSLFATKRELFLAALERSFELVAHTFEHAVAEYEAGRAPADCADPLEAMGRAYVELLSSDRDYLMLQHQSYAACHDDVVRACVRHRYAQLVALAARISGAEGEELDHFFCYGMALNVAAALGVEGLSVDSEWVRAELDAPPPR